MRQHEGWIYFLGSPKIIVSSLPGERPHRTHHAGSSPPYTWTALSAVSFVSKAIGQNRSKSCFCHRLLTSSHLLTDRGPTPTPKPNRALSALSAERSSPRYRCSAHLQLVPPWPPSPHSGNPTHPTGVWATEVCLRTAEHRFFRTAVLV